MRKRMLRNIQLWPKVTEWASNDAENRNWLPKLPDTVPTTKQSLPSFTYLLTSTPDTAEGTAEIQTSHWKDIILEGINNEGP